MGRAPNGSSLHGMAVVIDQSRSGLPCRCDPNCRFIKHTSAERAAHEIAVHGAEHVVEASWSAVFQSGYKNRHPKAV